MTHLDNLGMSLSRRKGERGVTGVVADIDFGVGGQQGLYHFEVAVQGGRHQGGIAALVHGVGVGAGPQQVLRHFFGDGVHEHGPADFSFAGVGVGAGVQKQAHLG